MSPDDIKNRTLPDIADLNAIIEKEAAAYKLLGPARVDAEKARQEIVNRYLTAGVAQDYCDHPIKTNMAGGYGTICACCNKQMDY